jgi:hypothetical protein
MIYDVRFTIYDLGSERSDLEFVDWNLKLFVS